MRSKFLKREMQTNLRWCLGIVGVALVVSPLVLTNDEQPITATLAVQAVCLGLAGLLLLNRQVHAAFSHTR